MTSYSSCFLFKYCLNQSEFLVMGRHSSEATSTSSTEQQKNIYRSSVRSDFQLLTTSRQLMGLSPGGLCFPSSFRALTFLSTGGKKKWKKTPTLLPKHLLRRPVSHRTSKNCGMLRYWFLTLSLCYLLPCPPPKRKNPPQQTSRKIPCDLEAKSASNSAAAPSTGPHARVSPQQHHM